MTQPTIIPKGGVSPSALEGGIDEFLTREGPDYGDIEQTLEQKRAQVREELDSGEVVILFEPEDQSCSLVRRIDLGEHLRTRRSPSMAADPKLDSLILTYIVADDLGALDQLARAGLNREQVRTRATALGLNTDLVRRIKLTGRQPMLRACLNCNAPFISAGLGNRLCARCQ